MSGKPKEPIAKSGKFRLFPPYGNKYTSYRIEWYDDGKGQTVGTSIGTTDRKVAEEHFNEFVVKHDKGLHKDELVLQALNRYYLKYAINLPSASTVCDTIKVVTEFWPTEMVSKCGAALQQKIVEGMWARGVSDDTISRRFNDIWAAFNYAAENQHLPESSIPTRMDRRHWGVRTHPRKRRSALPSKRRLLPEELGRLFDACDSEHAFRYLVLAIATGCRPRAILDLTACQAQFEYNVLDLNPPERAQNKKRRPIVPMCPTLSAWMTRWTQGASANSHILQYRGKPIVTRNFIRRNIRLAHAPNCTAYTIRHTISTWLALQKVDKWERKCFMGHARPDGGSTDNYTHYEPGYLRTAAEAIQRLFEAIEPHTKRVLLINQVIHEDQPEPLDARQLGWLDAGLSDRFARWVGLTPIPPPAREELVGAGSIELPTSCMSSKRSTTELRTPDPNPISPTLPLASLRVDPLPSTGGSSFEGAPWRVRGAATTNFELHHQLTRSKLHDVKDKEVKSSS